MYLRNRINVLLILLTIFLNCSIDDPHDEIVVYEENRTRITLLNVADYRCPSDVLCFWSGNAEVLMRIQKNGQSEDFVLNTHGEISMPWNTFSDNIELFGINIELINLEPYPTSESSFTTDTYTVTLDVSE